MNKKEKKESELETRCKILKDGIRPEALMI